MSTIHIHGKSADILVNPEASNLEIVERKFRGHPDSLADQVAQRFTQLYIKHSWQTFPELENKFFPNFSADKVTLCGASTSWKMGSYKVLKPVQALLIGKITQNIGGKTINVDQIFRTAINETFEKCLGHTDANVSVDHHIYGVTLAGSDHDPSFYSPKSVSNLLDILSRETHANDTVFVVAYAPLSVTERLSIFLDNVTAGTDFQEKFPEIGSDIKAMIRRRSSDFDITMCLPVSPERVQNAGRYQEVLRKATSYLNSEASRYLAVQYGEKTPFSIRLSTNTKDTKDKKYYAVWGTSLSKGDIGAVGRGNRQQGFISGLRPSTNEAFSGKNPNHFSGIVYQQMAEKIALDIFTFLGLRNVVYITADNGNKLSEPSSIDVILENDTTPVDEGRIREIISVALGSISVQRSAYIEKDIYGAFMKPTLYEI
jgi:S-adenosylmethionine synthetase